MQKLGPSAARSSDLSREGVHLDLWKNSNILVFKCGLRLFITAQPKKTPCWKSSGAYLSLTIDICITHYNLSVNFIYHSYFTGFTQMGTLQLIHSFSKQTNVQFLDFSWFSGAFWGRFGKAFCFSLYFYFDVQIRDNSYFVFWGYFQGGNILLIYDLVTRMKRFS